MRFFVSGQGFTYVDQHGNAQMIGRGHVFDTTLDEAPARLDPAARLRPAEDHG